MKYLSRRMEERTDEGIAVVGRSYLKFIVMNFSKTQKEKEHMYDLGHTVLR